MKKLLGFVAVLVAFLGAFYVAGASGYAPALDLADGIGVSHVLGFDESLVSTDFATPEGDEVRTGLSYTFLNESQKAVYHGLFRAAASKLVDFSLRIENLDDIEPALTALLEDHPEFFWLDGSCTYSKPLGSQRTAITFDFNIEASEIETVQGKIDAAVRAYYATIPEGASTYDKVRLAYEFVILNTDYSFASRQNQNVQSVFIDGLSVCAGYARAFQYLLGQVDIPCSFVRGSIQGGAEDHAWNLVTIDGVQSYVDTTWGDPTYSGPRGEDVSGTITYDYLCLTTEELERDRHVATFANLLPVCSDSTYDFYRMNGLYFDSYDFTAVNEALRRAIENGQTQVAFKFGSDEAYAASVADLEDRAFLRGAFQDLAISRGDSMSKHQYATSDALRVVRFFWE